jgi:electron transfer flavoprotein alpha subunit
LKEDLVKSNRLELRNRVEGCLRWEGLEVQEAFDQVLLPLADCLKAAVGASRAAVDSGFADNSLQVG